MARWRLPDVIPWWWKAIALLIVLILAWMVFRGWLDAHDDAVARASVAAQAKRTAVAAETIATDAGEVQAETQRVEVVVTQQRDTFNRRAEEVINANPTVRTYVAQPVPTELRQLARERRESRERLDGPEAGSSGTDGTKGRKR